MENKKQYTGIPFKVQYDKIVSAYLKNELNPLKCNACFVGNLLNNSHHWGTVCTTTPEKHPRFPVGIRSITQLKAIAEESNGLYTSEDISNLEYNFLFSNRPVNSQLTTLNDAEYEEWLFKSMESTLLMLRQIHESHGEVIEDYEFKQRQPKEVVLF